MTVGGNAEDKREKEKESTIVDNTREERAGSDDFGRAISRTAVAQICESIGFEIFNESALESLADIAIKYIRDLGKTASSSANLAGRTQCNVFDIIQGLEDMCASTGFLRASEVNRCGLNSGIVSEMVEYVESAEEIPFSQSLPHFPVVKHPKMIPSFSQINETPAFKHVPPWLPAFPDQHTYVRTPTWNERASDPRADKIELARQRRKAERSLLNLQQRLLCNGSAGASTSMQQPDDVGISKSENPFLAKPFQAGEKAVEPPVALPAKLLSSEVADNNKNHVSLLETFSPAIEAMKDGFDGSEKKLPDKRPAVCLEFRPGKKGLGDSLDLRLWKKGSGRNASLFRRDDERDDKKRRAELILRQSRENQQELTQL
ncbi:transcription initiation factor TFIID subunit 8 [Lycium barbarum]|uniref:transcription initiation factor TFIID subunit 8 n=1 Tax=Lycium barbarum TaxID=112863 RepID=UPI00293F6844|nr:transcription initiation factor TFIID subunit 8 [Lycium barbarum]